LSSKNLNCFSPFLPLPKNVYINPLKSSAPGGKKNLNLPFFLPALLAPISEYLASDLIPLFSCSISLKSLSKFLGSFCFLFSIAFLPF